MTKQESNALERIEKGVLKAIEERQSEMAGDLKGLKTTVCGNGGKGHEQRLNDLEEYVKNHPLECPLVKRKIPPGQLVALIIAGASLATTWVVLLI